MRSLLLLLSLFLLFLSSQVQVQVQGQQQLVSQSYVVPNYNDVVGGNLNSVYGSASASILAGAVNITYTICSPIIGIVNQSNTIEVDAILTNQTLVYREFDFCGTFCDYESQCVSGLVQTIWRSDLDRITKGRVTDTYGAVLGNLVINGTQQLTIAPVPPTVEVLLQVQRSLNPTTTMPPTTLPPTTLPPTTLPPTTLPPTTLPPTTLPPTTIPPIPLVSCPPASYFFNNTCVNCSLGYIQPNINATSCEICVAGSHSSADFLSCTLCSSGFFQSSEGQSSCLPCVPGTFQNNTNSTSCTSCAVDTFTNTTQATSCAPCPGLMVTRNVTGALSCQVSLFVPEFNVTDIGNSYPDVSIFSLPPSSPYISYYDIYANGINTQQVDGNSSSFAISDFDPNTWYNITIIPRSIGGLSGAPLYVVLPPRPSSSGISFQPLNNRTANISWVSPSICPFDINNAVYYNLYLNRTGYDLQVITTNNTSFVIPGLQIGDHISWTLDTHVIGETSGVILSSRLSLHHFTAQDYCTSGSYFQPSDGSCQSCSPGTVQPLVNQTSCNPCSTGSYQPDSHQSECLICDQGSFSNTTSATGCIPCSLGYIQPLSNSTSCVACNIGTFQNTTGSTSCYSCVPGTYQTDIASSSCLPCISGFYQNASQSTSCLTCEAGKYSPSTTLSCVDCNPGTFTNTSSATSCRSCVSGSYQTNSSQTSCVTCNPGYFSVNTTSVCQSCPVGSFSFSASSTSCLECAVGYYQNVTASTYCIQCASGSFSNTTGSTACATCPVGTSTSLTASTLCTVCNSGSYQPSTGSTSCLVCASGSYSNTTTTCLTCLPGSFSGSASSTVCTDCTPGSYQPSTNTTSCVLCAAGSFSNSTTTCVACPLGSFSPSPSSITCTSCTNGSYQNTTGSTSCIPCASGSYSNTTTTCLTCPSGSFSPSPSSTNCTVCAAGLYQNSTGSTSCVGCAAGTFSNSNSSTTCVSCLPGSFSNSTGSTTCTPCTVGYFQTFSGKTSCQLCNGGYFTATLSTCIACNSGQFSADMSTSCTDCTAGKYQPFTSSSSCLTCSLGSVTPTTRTCVACALNTFGNSTNLTSCYACPSDQEAISTGSINCTYRVPVAVTDIINSASQPSVITWTAATYATNYIFRTNTDPIATTSGATTSNILLYDPDTWYTITVTPGVDNFATLGPVSSVVIPARPQNVTYDFDVVARTINISWTPAPSMPAGAGTITYTLFYSGQTFSGLSSTFRVFTGIANDANLTWSVRTQTSNSVFSSNTTIGTLTAYQSASDAYQQYLFKNNFADTSYNTFANSKAGCIVLTYSNDTVGSINRDTIAFPYLNCVGNPATVGYISSSSNALTASYTFSSWVNSNSSNWTLVTGGTSAPPLPGYYRVGVRDGAYVTATMTSYTMTRTLTVSSNPRVFPLNTWVHVSVTYDSNTGVLSLYWNGDLQSSATNAGFINDWPSRLSTIINSPVSGTIPYLNGMLSELQVFDVAVNPSQVKALYTFKAKQTVPNPIGCTVKVGSSLLSVNLSTNSVLSGGTSYTSGQSITWSSGSMYANSPICPGGTVTSEDTVGFRYLYICSLVSGQYRIGNYYERSYSSISGAQFRSGIHNGAILSYGAMNVTCISPYTVTVQPPIVQLSFDNATFADSSSNQYAVTVQSEVLIKQDARRGIVASFTSTSGAARKFVQIGTVTLPRSYTISAFVNLGADTSNNLGYVIVQGTGLTGLTSTVENAFALTSGTSGSSRILYRQYAGGSELVIDAISDFSVLLYWVHVTVTYDATTGILTSFMEGDRQRYGSTVANATDAHRNAWNGGLGIELGTSHGSTGASFDGLIDQFMVFNYVLNDTQIKRNYNNSYRPITPVGVSTVNPITSGLSNTPSNPATVTWTAPSSPPLSELVYVVTVNSVVSYILPPASATPSYTIPGYSSSQSYVISVAASNQYGAVTTAATGTIPIVPSSFTPTQTITGNGTLSWASTGVSVSYVTYVSYNGSFTVSAVLSTTDNTTSWNNNAADDTIISLKVQSLFGSLYSGNSTFTNITILGGPPSDPVAQLLLQANRVDTSSNSWATSLFGSPEPLYGSWNGRQSAKFASSSIQFTSLAQRSKTFTLAFWMSYIPGTIGYMTGSVIGATRSVLSMNPAGASNSFVSVSLLTASGTTLSHSMAVAVTDNVWIHYGITFNSVNGTLTTYRDGNYLSQQYFPSLNNGADWAISNMPTVGPNLAGAYITAAYYDFHCYNYIVSHSKIKLLATIQGISRAPSSCTLNLDSSLSNVQIRINSTAATPTTSTGSFITIPIGTTVYLSSPVCVTNGNILSQNITGFNYYYTCQTVSGFVQIRLNNKCTGTSGGTGCTSTSTSQAAFDSFPVSCILLDPVTSALSNSLSAPQTFTWVAPTNYPPSGINYKVTVNGAISYVAVASFTISSYSSSTTYSVSVSSTNTAQTAETIAVTAIVPPAPVLTSAYNIAGTVAITWGAPVLNSGSVASYLVYVGTAPSVSTTSLSILQAGLTGGSTVVFKAQSITNTGLYSGNSTVSVLIDAPPALQLEFEGGFTDVSTTITPTVSGSSSVTRTSHDSRFGSVLDLVGNGVLTGSANNRGLYYSTTTLTRAYTYSLWVKLPTLTGGGDRYPIIAYGPDTVYNIFGTTTLTQAHALECWDTGDVRAIMRNSGTDFAIISSTITAGQWTHFAVTYDTSTRNFAIYTNGVIGQNTFLTPTAAAAWTAGRPIALGCSGTGNCYSWAAQMKYVKVWQTSLSATAISDEYTATSLLRPASPAVVVMPYLSVGGMDAIAGTNGAATWRDFSSNQFVATTPDAFSALVRNGKSSVSSYYGRLRNEVFSNGNYNSRFQYTSATLGSSYSICAWITGMSADPTVFVTNVNGNGFGTTTNQEFYFGVNSGHVTAGKYAANLVSVTDPYSHDAQRFVHYCYTYDQTTGNMALYRNSGKVATAVADSTHRSTWTGGLQLQVSRSATFGFVGDFSELRIYNTVLTTVQVSRLFQQTASEIGPYIYLPFTSTNNDASLRQFTTSPSGAWPGPEGFGSVGGRQSLTTPPNSQAKQLTIGNDAVLPLSFSFSIRYNIQSGINPMILFSHVGSSGEFDTTTNGFLCYIVYPDLVFKMISGTSATLSVTIGGVGYAYNWYMATVTYDATTGTLKAYNEATLVSTVTDATFITNWDSGKQITLGTSTNKPFGGSLAQFNVYARAITATEVLGLSFV